MKYFRQIMTARMAIYTSFVLSVLLGCSVDSLSREIIDSDANMTLSITWKEFEELKVLNGQSYLDARDNILQMPGIEGRLRSYLSSDDWQDYFQAKILLDWLEYGDFYQEILLNINSDELSYEVERLRPTAMGVTIIYNGYRYAAENEYGDKINSLCLEHVLKSDIDSESWQVGIFANMLYMVPDQNDIDSSINLVMNINDEIIKNRILTYLGSMPSQAILPKLDDIIRELEQYIDKRLDGYRDKVRQRRMLLILKNAIESQVN